MPVRVRHFCRIIFGLVVAASFGMVPVVMAEGELRSWGDAKGKNKIKAKFVKLEDNVVTLEKEDGDEVEIELKKLSPADQKFATEAAKDGGDNPFKAKTDDPFKVKPKGGKKKSAADTEDAPETGEFKTFKFKIASAKQIKSGAPSKSWRIELPEAEPQTPVELVEKTSIPAKVDFFERLNGMAISRDVSNKMGVIGYYLDKHGQDAMTRVVICDLKSGESSSPASTKGQYVPVALHDDGRRIVARSTESGWGKNDRLEVWTLNGDEVSKQFTWTPYDFETGGNRDVTWVEFLDKDKLATCNSLGKLIFWKFPDIKPLAVFETGARTVPALGHDRKMLAYSVGNAIGVLDIAKQKVLAQQAVSSSPVEINLEFSPSGKLLAGVSQGKLLVWDLVSGKLQKTISCDGLNSTGGVVFIDEDFVLVGNSNVIDLQNEVKLWTYSGAEHVRSLNGTVFFAVSDGTERNGALITAQLPHSNARDLLERALKDPVDFVLKPGATIRIDVSGIADASQRERVTQGLTKQLAANRWTVDPNGTLEAVATVEGPKETRVSFRQRGDYKFKEYTVRIKLVSGKQAIWEAARNNSPNFVQLKSGESMEDYLRGQEKPSYEFFEHVVFPMYLMKPASGTPPGNSVTIGTSRVTVDGIQ